MTDTERDPASTESVRGVSIDARPLSEKDRENLRREIGSRSWYHSIDLGQGIVTPGRSYDELWTAIRRCRERIDYRNATVLDLASWDGLWAFEAERRGARLVVATDCTNTWHGKQHTGMDNLLFLRQVLNSGVLPFWNVSPMSLTSTLMGVLYANPITSEGFDVVQHLGLLYHLRDPLRSLAQARAVLKPDGRLLLETAVYESDQCAMFFNEKGKALFDDASTWWAPTRSCLREMLRTSLFELDEESVTTTWPGDERISRIALWARAVPPHDPVDLYTVDPGFGAGFGDRLVEKAMKAVKAMKRPAPD